MSRKTVDKEVWIGSVLVNDEDSTDEQMIEYFRTEGPMPKKEARCYVGQRSKALKNPLDFNLKSCKIPIKNPRSTDIQS